MSWPILLTVIAVSLGLGAVWQSKRGCSHCRENNRHTSIVGSVIELAENELAAGKARGKAADLIRVRARSEHSAETHGNPRSAHSSRRMG